MLAALLFDLDGTLSDTDPIHLRAWQDMLAPFGLSVDEEFYRTRFSGRRNPEIIQDLLPQLPDEQKAALAEDKEAHFRELARGLLVPLAGALELIDWAKRRQLACALVSNAPRPNVHFMLEVLQLQTVFDAVVLGDDLPHGKPDPLPYRVALEQLGVHPRQAIAFEDSPSGVRSAVGAAIPTVGITSTQSAEKLRELGVVLAVPDFCDQQLWALLVAAASG
ncbi:HAD family hydrolase [Gloeobacter kilaueensis]|uniref:HAD-superfamily hydrolase n=1 Tax=Gloeobacter kilaueensis (strain ATCC BAA-2537 / CCAP 1431/1 / ULC 316 / JS1) TaxID=1183438 RepID=U5QSH6_GLOK1|nr:HAD-IA family hydrolase [Gloeobacter kilaueensis]AGY60690.1 HAD-superfamily hydrolase [Gloeobacter kilaueensis JS1]